MSLESGDDYHATLVEALTKTVFEASLVDLDGKRTAYVRTAEACEALISVMGMLLESTPNCRTPQGMRKMSESVGRNALIAMKAARKVREENGAGILGMGVIVN